MTGFIPIPDNVFLYNGNHQEAIPPLINYRGNIMSNLNKAFQSLTSVAAGVKKAYGATTKAAKAFKAAGKDHRWFICPTGNKAAESTCTAEAWSDMRGHMLAGFTKAEQEVMALADSKAKLSPAQRATRDRVNGNIRDTFSIMRRALKGLDANAKAAKTGAKTPTAKIDGHDKVLERLTAAIKTAKDCMSENGFKEVHKLAAMIQKQVVADKKIPQ